MSAHFYGSLNVDLRDAPIRTVYHRAYNGDQLAELIVGDGPLSIAITVASATPEKVAELAAAATELAAWAQQVAALKAVA